jgi:site-specific recombinase XerD
MRVYHNGEKSEKFTGAYLHRDNEWNEELSGIIGNKVETTKLREINSRFDNFILKHQFDIGTYSSKVIINEVLGIKTINEKHTVLKFFEDYLESFILSSKDLSNGTKKNYQKTFKHFKVFTEKNSISNLPIQLFNSQHASDFYSFLLSPTSDDAYFKKIKKPMFKVSATNHIKKMKTIFKHAIDLEIISKNPFRGIENTNKSTLRTRLNDEQLRLILKCDLSNEKTLEIYNDLFVLTVLTGLSYQDLMLLDENTICKSDKGLYLSTKRIKTEYPVEMYLPEMAITILNKFKELEECQATKRMIPYRSNTQLNKNLKKVANYCGINFNLFHYHARYAFRRNICEAGIVEPLVRKLLMGHSTHKDIDAVYHIVTKEHLYNAKFKMDEYISKLVSK